jgi:hypothetical protein
MPRALDRMQWTEEEVEAIPRGKREMRDGRIEELRGCLAKINFAGRQLGGSRQLRTGSCIVASSSRFLGQYLASQQEHTNDERMKIADV